MRTIIEPSSCSANSWSCREKLVNGVNVIELGLEPLEIILLTRCQLPEQENKQIL